eukprot:Clim_evm101s109 gene=Clim_evmTU101s109
MNAFLKTFSVLALATMAGADPATDPFETAVYEAMLNDIVGADHAGFYLGSMQEYWCGSKAKKLETTIRCATWFMKEDDGQIVVTYREPLEGSITTDEGEVHLKAKQDPNKKWYLQWAKDLQIGESQAFSLSMGYEGTEHIYDFPDVSLLEDVTFSTPRLWNQNQMWSVYYFPPVAVPGSDDNEKLQCVIFGIARC